MIGAILALVSAAMFGLNTAIVRRGVLIASPYYGILISLTVAVPFFVVFAAVSGQLGRASELSTGAYGLLALGGFLNFIGGRYANFHAIRAYGANLSAPVRTLSSLLSATLGVVFLDEQVDAMLGLGIALLVIAPLIAFSNPSAIGRDLRGGTRLQLMEGAMFGLISAGSYSGATFLLRYVLADTGLALVGAAVAHGGAASFMLLTLAIPGRFGGLRGLDRRAIKLFGLITATMIIAQVFWFSALEAAPISVVAPLVETLAFFGLGFAYIFNRDMESFNRNVVVGIVIAVVGAIAVTL